VSTTKHSFPMQWLDARSSGPFAPLALSYTRDILLDPGLGDRRLAVGTTLLGLPAGLGIASLAVEGGDSWVESLAVSRMFEGRGIATALLQTLEAALRERGCTAIHMTYTTGSRTAPALERVLEKCGWPPGQVSRLLFKARCPEGTDNWAQRDYTLPPDVALFNWAELTEREVAAVLEQTQRDPRYEGAMINPARTMEPLNSLGIRYGGEIAGWIHVRRAAPDTLVYDNFWLRRDMRRAGRMGVGMKLLAESIRRQLGADIPWTYWATAPDNRHMLRLVHAYLDPYVVAIREVRRAGKQLDGEHAGQGEEALAEIRVRKSHSTPQQVNRRTVAGNHPTG